MLAKVDALPRSQREAAVRDGDIERGPDDRALSYGETSQPQRPAIERGAEAGGDRVGGAGGGRHTNASRRVRSISFAPKLHR